MSEHDLDAAERALGTLPGDDSRPGHAQNRAAWEARLAPLLEVVPPAAPPVDMLDRIEAEIDREQAVGGDVVSLAEERRRRKLWRGVAGVSSLTAAAAAAVAIWFAAPLQETAPDRYVAVVRAPGGGEAGMVVELDIASGVATVIPVALTPPEGKAYEMWRVPGGNQAPVSIGLLPERPRAALNVDARPGDLFAISLEQPGGSVTGAPGEVVFVGPLTPVR